MSRRYPVCVEWFKQYGFDAGTVRDRGDARKGIDTSIDGLDRAGVLKSAAGKVKLLSVREIPDFYDPESDERTSEWEICLHLAKALQDRGADEAARLMAAAREVPGIDLDDVKELAYLLYSIAEKKGWAETALLFNNLGTSWTDSEDASRKLARGPVPGAGRASSRWSSGATTMATSNKERVGQGLELLAAGLEPFVDAAMSAAAPAGQDWVAVLEARDNAKHGTAHKYSRSDPRFLLKVLTEEWRVFSKSLSRAEQSFATELRDTGNRWGHNDPFSADDTYRALDTMERLLTAVDATAEADAVRKLKRDAQSAAFSSETRRAVQVVTGVEGHGLKPWREVITPHRDVRDGKMRGAEFAADLYWVSRGEGSREYVEPAEFFRRTYLTDGLRELLRAAARRIGGDRNASPVWNLQTNFGGGKTHSMLALYHLLSGTPLAEYPDEVRKLLAGVTLPAARRAVLVGNHFKAGAATPKPGGTQVHTLWGELAWQLGFSAGGEAEARRAYEIVRAADETRSNPADSLGTLIASYAPCLILIDEWVAYARQLYGRDDLAGGTFDTQFTFAQTLTEVVKAVPGALLVVSIPASSAAPTGEEAERGATELEVGGLNGVQALARLQQVIHRIADQWRPASPVESFAIVRQRLFEEPGADAQADIGAVARVFTDFYAKNRAEFPAGVADPSYEERITSAYPLHPELFDRLYHDWSTLDRFQRTRGVLRLMSAVIHELWERDDPAPLIMPGGVPLDADDVLTEISQYLEDSFKPVIDADIDGASSTPARIDASRPALGQRKITRRLARAIFLGSAPTLKAAHRGIERQHIWLGIATPGDTIGNFANALSLLSDQATYLYSEGARYWYATAASVQKMAARARRPAQGPAGGDLGGDPRPAARP